MTKKDYVKISSAIHSHAIMVGTDQGSLRDAVLATALAISRAIDSPNFDRERFLIACGVPVDPEPNR